MIGTESPLRDVKLLRVAFCWRRWALPRGLLGSVEAHEYDGWITDNQDRGELDSGVLEPSVLLLVSYPLAHVLSKRTNIRYRGSTEAQDMC